MTKDQLIPLRDALCDHGNHRSVRLLLDNGIVISTTSDQVFWDDDTGMMIAFYQDSQSGSFESNLPIAIIGSPYEYIQYIQANTVVEKPAVYKDAKVEDLATIIDNLSKAYPALADKKDVIVEWYKILNKSTSTLATKTYLPTDIVRD